MKMRVRIRRGTEWEVRPEAEQLDGRVFEFERAWTMGESDPYPGEMAYMPNDETYPHGAPIWIASGDLERIE